MSSNVSFSGLASGLNSGALVQNLLRFSQQRINQLQQTVQTNTTQQLAFQGVQTRLQTLETQASSLAQSQGSVFDGKTVASSNSDLVTAAAGTGAQTGVTSLRVLALAQASQIASQGYADPNSAISTGTFQIQAGGNSASLSIDSSNNTLSGLAQAINSASIGVTATIVNTGSSDPRTQPYRLLLSSTSTGTANAVKITNNLGASAGGAILPNFSTTEVGPAVTSSGYSGTSGVTSNSGSGNYTGSANDTFTFSVLSGGTVGTDSGLQVSYSNSSGTKTGTLTLNAADVGTNKDVVDGLQVKFAAGTLTTGDQFTVNVFSPTIQAATNSQVQLGSGAGAVVVQNSSNTLTNLVAGVTLKLQSADPTKTVQLNVSNDVTAATTQITNFVNDYNDFASFLETQASYTPGIGTAVGTAGPLNGNASLTGIQNQVEQALLAVTPNLPSQINRLDALGITPDSNGQLQIDKDKLSSALTGGVSGVSFNDIKNLFALQGTSSSAGVQFSTGSEKTNPTTTPYGVHITQAATRASITSASSLASNTVINGTNNSISLTIDGAASGTITLASGTYSQLALANEIQTEINSKVAANGKSVSATISNNNLVITSDRYGAASSITGISGSALTALGYSGTESSTGTDVAGSYVVNGVTETATGIGQILTGNSANSNTSGLVVVVSLTPAQILAGASNSTLTVTRGLAATLDNSLKSLLDPVNGQLTLLGNQITKSINDAQAEVTAQTASVSDEQAKLLSQFAALETVLANLQSQSNLISSAFSGSSSSSTATAATSSNFSNIRTG